MCQIGAEVAYLTESKWRSGVGGGGLASPGGGRARVQKRGWWAFGLKAKRRVRDEGLLLSGKTGTPEREDGIRGRSLGVYLLPRQTYVTESKWIRRAPKGRRIQISAIWRYYKLIFSSLQLTPLSF